jgi:hypothetical protein
MADCFSGWIKIGGQLPRSLLPEFLEVLRDSGAGAEWQGGFQGTDEVSLSELRNLSSDGTLRLRNHAARWGQFEELEMWCRDNGLSYDRYAEAYCQFDAEYARWRPGWEDEKVSISDQDGDELVPLEDVIAAKRLLVEDKIADSMAALDRLIDGHDAIPELPPFTIVD